MAVGDLILTEVLQGFRGQKHFPIARALFEDVSVFEILGRAMAIKSDNDFRTLRRKGVTIRKTADVIIASLWIWQNPPLLSSDKDFKPLVKHFGLIAA